ncbi:MAG: peptide-methionine (S)-S-oxide reductase [Crocinitomicaceae bacterium]|nr:peptide-methionine (S)-S-oxide reductase [Crocinitomicaceae bacterium]
MKFFLFIFLVSITLKSCAQDSSSKSKVGINEEVSIAYFASGCFWCVEAIFESVSGVEEVISGYAGGIIKNPTYSQVSSGQTKHAEAVKIYYNPSIVSYSTLVEVFFNSHNPFTLNRQGPDIGTQYRSIAFYNNHNEKRIIHLKIDQIFKSKKDSVTTELVPFKVFYAAENYHQDFKKKHPNNSYVKAVSLPRLNAFKKKMPNVLKVE